MAERIIQSGKRADEVDLPSLRPKTLSEYIGQSRVKETLAVTLDAAKKRGEAVDHILFHGPPGLGKTTLAHIIAEEMGVRLISTAGPTLEKGKDLAAILTNLGEKDVFFIDEIHRLNRAVEETLYPAMEDFVLDILIGTGPSARSLQLKLEKFTLVGATTRAGLLTGPLRDRFGIALHLDFYEPAELEKILYRSAKILNISLSSDGAVEISVRARGTPRVANRILKRIRDWAQVKGDGSINRETAIKACEMLGIDHTGLDELDRRFLSVIVEYYDGGPVGIETLAATLNEERDTITDVIEPYLLKIGFLQRTPRGRVITRPACKHLGVPFPFDSRDNLQPDLFEEIEE